MEYVYNLANVSLTLRLVKHLHQMPQLPVKFMTVIHQTDGWVISVNLALWSLEAGENPIDVMRRHQVVVVSHGSPKREEIQAFQQQMIRGLGYCPTTLA